MSEGPKELNVASKSQVTNFDLYKLYSEENHKYNSIIWQFPVAVIGVNVLAFDKVAQSPWFAALFLLLNLVLTLFLAKHVYHQGCFTTALQELGKRLKEENGNLTLVQFRKEDGTWFWRLLKRIRASEYLVYSMFLFNVVAYIGFFIHLCCVKVMQDYVAV